MKKYEIEAVFHPLHFFESQICSLTGLELEEVLQHTKKIKTWRSRTYIDLFRELGFNTNHRFIKFDPDTKYPCLMRTKEYGPEGKHWYGFVYYDHLVYMIGEDTEQVGAIGLNRFKAYYPQLKITSMLQVWI